VPNWKRLLKLGLVGALVAVAVGVAATGVELAATVGLGVGLAAGVEVGVALGCAAVVTLKFAVAEDLLMVALTVCVPAAAFGTVKVLEKAPVLSVRMAGSPLLEPSQLRVPLLEGWNPRPVIVMVVPTAPDVGWRVRVVLLVAAETAVGAASGAERLATRKAEANSAGWRRFVAPSTCPVGANGMDRKRMELSFSDLAIHPVGGTHGFACPPHDGVAFVTRRCLLCEVRITEQSSPKT
jgi:hypothetical protein